MGAGGVVGQSRCLGESCLLLCLTRPGDSPPSTDAARHTLQRSAPYCGSWSTTPSAGARKTWFEECEGHYQDYVCRGRAKRLLGRTWIFPLRRTLTPFNMKDYFSHCSALERDIFSQKRIG